MNEHELEKIRAFEKDHWWYRSLYKYSLAHLRGLKEETIIDLGCGTGFFLKKISKISARSKLLGFDLLESESIDHNVHIHKKKIQTCLINIKSNTVSYIFAHDSLYFLDQQERLRLYSEIARVLVPGGEFIIQLPALSVFSRSHDKFVGISQRFNKAELKKELEDGFRTSDVKIKNIRYRVFLLSVFIFFISVRDKFLGEAKRSDLKKVPFFINKILYCLQLIDDRVFSFAPWGSSLYVSLEKSKVASAKIASTY